MVGKAGQTNKGARLVTEGICAICFTFKSVISEDEIKKSRGVGGGNTLLICNECFKSDIQIPTSGGSSNVREKKQQKSATKTRNLQTNMSSKRKKTRQ